MTRKSQFRQVDIKRALTGTKDAGYNPSAIRISIDGSIEILIGDTQIAMLHTPNLWDSVDG
jgi:hypothetical protein